ncbi:hypothetical protein [Shimia sp.]
MICPPNSRDGKPCGMAKMLASHSTLTL